MPGKLLMIGQPNSGKTSLLKGLDKEKTLVIARDGKRFPLPLPHKTINDFNDVDDLINQVSDAISSYVEKFDKNPEIVVIDSISKILLDIESRILAKIKSFPYGVINTEIAKLMDFLEEQIAPNCTIVFISHSIYDADTGVYQLVNAGGSWAKKGGMLSEVNNSVFIEIKGKKRILHNRSYAMSARSTLDDIEDSIPLEEYDLQTHLEQLNAASEEADKYEL